MKLVLAALVAIGAVWGAVAGDIPSPVFTNSLGMPFAKVTGTKVLFCIWPTRVQDYDQWLKATGKSAEAPSYPQGPTHPAVNVNWNEATAFCQWLTDKERKAGTLAAGQSYRLPTDSEWSAAVGLNESVEGTPEAKDGKVKDVFPWGTEWPPPKDAGNYGARLQVDTYRDTSPVGSFKPNGFGLYDVGGNVDQWCEDWYNARQKDRTLRGGGFASDSRSSLSSARRGYMKPEYRMLAAGFRCVLAGKE